MTMTMKNELTTAPLIGSTMNKVDNEYIKYKINRRFAPDVPLISSRFIKRK